MLIEFSVKNYRCIFERQTLNMTASAYSKKLESQNTFMPKEGNKSLPRLLRSSVLYGPNASGKSTLIQALLFMKRQVLESQKKSQIGDLIDVVPFKLSETSRALDSEFQIVFVQEGVRYEYGFCCNKERFTEEWLIAYPLGRAQKWFHRVFDPEMGEDAYKFNGSFLGGRQRQVLSEQTRQNALFFSTAVQLNNKQLTPVFDWFKSRLRVISSMSNFDATYTMQCCVENGERKRVVKFMNGADLSIADIKIKESVFSADSLPKELPTVIKDELVKDMAGRKILEARFLHPDVDTQKPIEFAGAEESDGTRALFAFSGPWLDVIENERVLVVDELDASLHSHVLEYLIKYFHRENSKAQLIFSTHNTFPLSQKLFRRDQVWFIEKNAKSASHLYSLSDFSLRDNAAVERGYLNGRYGGIPFVKDLDFYGV